MTLRSVKWLSDISKMSILFVFKNTRISLIWVFNPLEFHAALRTVFALCVRYLFRIVDSVVSIIVFSFYIYVRSAC
jgi:hypothetical protein